MPNEAISILCTRPVNQALVQEAHSLGIRLDILSFIETEPIRTIEVIKETEQSGLRSSLVVFTSMNAVDAVTSILNGNIPNWQIYCIGYKTRELVSAYFGENAIIGMAENAQGLAERIVDDEPADEILFFCGDRRRQELPDILSENGIPVIEIEVYRTRELSHVLVKQYDGILFFSPSSVDSFFRLNNVAKDVVLFAIGTTTEQSIGKYCNNTIVISKHPGKEALVKQAIDYFSNI